MCYDAFVFSPDCKCRASLMLSEQNLWSLAVALYMRKGLETAENFARRIREEE